MNRNISKRKLVQAGGIQIGYGFITSDGQYWIQTAKGIWFKSVGEPELFWAEEWSEAAAREIMNS